MTMQCDPAKLRVIGEADVIEHFRLPQCHISSLPKNVLSKRARAWRSHSSKGKETNPAGDQYVQSLSVAKSAEFIKSTFVRLSKVSIPNFEGSQLEDLRKDCEKAHASEQFFDTVATNQWLRTTICGERIHSNVLPYDSYWSTPLGDESSSREHFPCHILKNADDEANDQRQTLGRKLSEWRRLKGVSGKECDIRKHKQDDHCRPSKTFWEVLDGVKLQKAKKQVSWVTWRGGTFVKKDAKQEFEAEVNAMENLCHPHIVYIFGINKEQGSLYMECMDSDLFDLILDKCKGGDKYPPFSHYNSVDILLQIAKAMAHMHQNGVIHGDLKSGNVLVSKFKISENRYRYLAKVADFGSSQMKIPTDGGGFRPAGGTTQYAAPEVLKFRDNRNKEISFSPEYIDIYSFGCIAFEVLTGETMRDFLRDKQPYGFKVGVKNGTWKPPLRNGCRKDKFLHIERLLSLIERCWGTAKQRPLFAKIVKELNAVRKRLPEDAPEMLQEEEGASEVSQPVDAPEELQEEGASEVSQRVDAPEELQGEGASEVSQQVDAPEELQEEGASEVSQQVDAREELQEEGASEVSQHVDAPEELQEEGASEVSEQVDAPEEFQEEGASEVSPSEVALGPVVQGDAFEVSPSEVALAPVVQGDASEVSPSQVALAPVVLGDASEVSPSQVALAPVVQGDASEVSPSAVALAPVVQGDASEILPSAVALAPVVQEDASEVSSSEVALAPVVQGDASEVSPSEVARAPIVQEDASEILPAEAALARVVQVDASEPDPTPNPQEAKPRRQRKGLWKKYFACFSCASAKTDSD